MELDEFKAHWKTIQEKEFMQQELTKEKLELIIMNTADTLNYLQKKSAYWSKFNRSTSRMLVGLIIPFSLLIIIKASLLAGKINSIEASLTFLGTSIGYMAIIIIYCIVTVWVLKRQLQIFTINNNVDLKEALTKTITDFKRFYVKFNIMYLFLYPVYYYAVIQLIIVNWTPPANKILLICGILTIVSLALGHLYYKIKYLNKIKLLEANLKELEEEV